MVTRKLIFLIIVPFFFAGCSLWKSREMPRNNPEALYQKGYEDYQAGSYENAVASFQRLKDEYPLSELAILAELGIADAYYSMKSYGFAEMAYNDFINLHPVNENLSYAMYQIGMCHYSQILTIDRDQTATWKALNEFGKLISRFPTSKFSFLAEKKVRECRMRLAEHEYYIGEIYFKMKKYNAAMKRFENIVKNYSNLGLDYKVKFIIEETKNQLAKTEGKNK